jgi:predicted phosphodiesterase
MKFAIIADVHANLEAFQAVLEDAKEQRCTHYAFLGDFVGNCADPKACLDIVRSMNAPCVKGNHDEYCARDMPLNGITVNVAKTVQWTRKQLTEEDRQWLEHLPYSCRVENFTIVHATLERPEQWHYVFDKVAASASFPYQKTQICFFGHTHVPVAFIRDTSTRGVTYKSLKWSPVKSTW